MKTGRAGKMFAPMYKWAVSADKCKPKSKRGTCVAAHESAGDKFFQVSENRI